MGLRKFLDGEQCCEIHAPCITFSDCEGGGQAFKIQDGEKIFGKDSYLTVSAQLHAEMAASALGRVYTFGPVFRAEKHHTSRHLAEFLMLEVEICFIDSVSQLMDFAEKMLRQAVGSIPEELWGAFKSDEMMGRRQALLAPNLYHRMTYSEAIRLLERDVETGKIQFTNPVRWGLGFSPEHEKYIAEIIVGGPVFVHDYPAPTKAFYMKSDSEYNTIDDWQQSTVSCFDLLLPHVAEVIGGSIREDRLYRLQKSMERFGLAAEDYEWYLDLRRFGSAPHGGFGLGFDRLLQYLTLTKNIRDVVLVPRAAGVAQC
jgi:asparaginyl-tRNA synthetase